MFDLLKDVEKYRGIPPYASELYGVYQPLLGWQSYLTKKWVRRGGALVDRRLKTILDGHITPAPAHVYASHPLEMVAVPLEPGAGRSPYTVHLAKDLQSELLKIVRGRVQRFADEHDGRLPDGAEWRQVVDVNVMMDADDGDLRKANDVHRTRLHGDALRRAPQGQLTEALTAEVRQSLLELMRYESQVGALLLFHAEAQAGYEPNELKKLFFVKKAAPLADVLRSTDPLADIDPNDRSGALSPVGFVHIFRQYFFNLGTFLGEPVEHVWLAPGTTIELVEVSTRRTLVERTLEQLMETTARSERESTMKDELSDAVKETNENSTKLGVSQSNTANLYVYQGTLSASMNLEASRSTTRETAHTQTREQSEKLSQEIKQSFRSFFRTVTETTDTKSRRHVIANPTAELLNYELRRKMRRVGVQVQDVGRRLCWQVFVDDPGAPLGLSELVHLVDSPDLANLKEPEKLPAPGTVAKKVVVPFPFKPVLNYHKNTVQYEYQGFADGDQTKPQLGLIMADEDDDDSQIVIEHPFKVDPPQTGYTLVAEDIRMTGVQGGKLAILRWAGARPDGSINVVLQRVNFGGENQVNLEFELLFKPTQGEIDRVNAQNAALQTKYDEEKRRLVRKAYLEAVRARIKDAAAIRARPSWDLREEERTVVYRKLLERLMLDSWKVPDTEQNRRVSHVRSELIRSIFDVDSMLYFVAPEWWMPRRHRGRLSLDVDLNVPAAPTSLTEADQVTWGGEQRDDNYQITEDSAPARLGSSLGWLLQLDGDNLRNAFLNAPWVKAVIPVRPGRESAALNWLRAIEGHENDGWDAEYVGGAAEDAEFAGKTVGEVLEIVADRLQQENGDIENVLAADKVFEHGFDHLAGGFDAGVAPNEVFSQWISVLPTDQIVAARYEPTDLTVPDA